MRAPRLVPLAVALCAASPARAEWQILAGWDLRGAWEDNVFRSDDIDDDATRIVDPVLDVARQDTACRNRGGEGFAANGRFTCVFSRDADEESDFSLYTGPNVGIRHHTRPLDVRLDYRLRYEEFVRLSGISDFEHFVDGEVDWRLTPRTSFRLDELFSQTSGVSEQLVGELITRRQQVTRNATRASLVHRLSAASQLELGFDATLYDYEEETQLDNRSLRGSLQYTRSLSARHIVGGGVAFTRQDFDESGGREGQGTNYYEGFGIWRYQHDPSLSFSLSAGPAWSDPDAEDDPLANTPQYIQQFVPGVGPRLLTEQNCPPPFGRCSAVFFDSQGNPFVGFVDPTTVPLAGGEFDTGEGSPTYFGRAILEKHWEEITASLGYQRSASTASGVGTSTTLDAVTGAVSWQPDRRWNVTFIAGWDRQEGDSEISVLEPVGVDTLFVDAQSRLVSDPSLAAFVVPGVTRYERDTEDSPIRIESYRLQLRARRQITENLSLVGSAAWRSQETDRDFDSHEVELDSFNDTDSFRVEFGFTWDLDPIRL